MRVSADVSAGGCLTVSESTQLNDWLNKRKGQRIEVELRDEAAVRSNRQNRYWRGVVVPYFVDAWERERKVRYPPGAVHHALVTAFDPSGHWYETPLGQGRRSTTEFTKAEFASLIDAVREYARETYRSEIPTPEEWSE